MKHLKSFAVGILSIIMLVSGVFAQDTEFIGAGATFPYPLYSKMFDVYNKSFGTRINYQSIGSGGGIRQLLSKTVDFGASDAFMSDEDLQKAPAEIVHIPIVLGAVTVTYNVAGIGDLNLSQEVLADIFLGTITKWNHPKIKEINPGVVLPGNEIVVVHRSDGSGTTAIFTDFLAKISRTWTEKVGRGKSVKWPAGLGAKGNEGVAGLIKQIPGSIGYVELAYTTQNNMPKALIQNKAGNFIAPGIESTSLSANIELPEDTRVSLTDTERSNGYPIAGFTWILIYREQNYDSRNKKQSEELQKLLWWMTHEGQKYAEPLDYAPLPAEVVTRAESIINSLHYNNGPLQ